MEPPSQLQRLQSFSSLMQLACVSTRTLSKPPSVIPVELLIDLKAPESVTVITPSRKSYVVALHSELPEVLQFQLEPAIPIPRYWFCIETPSSIIQFTVILILAIMFRCNSSWPTNNSTSIWIPDSFLLSSHLFAPFHLIKSQWCSLLAKFKLLAARVWSY